MKPAAAAGTRAGIALIALGADRKYAALLPWLSRETLEEPRRRPQTRGHSAVRILRVCVG